MRLACYLGAKYVNIIVNNYIEDWNSTDEMEEEPKDLIYELECMYSCVKRVMFEGLAEFEMNAFAKMFTVNCLYKYSYSWQEVYERVLWVLNLRI